MARPGQLTVAPPPCHFPIDRVFAFDDIGKAFEHMDANKHLGKIVVTL